MKINKITNSSKQPFKHPDNQQFNRSTKSGPNYDYQETRTYNTLIFQHDRQIAKYESMEKDISY